MNYDEIFNLYIGPDDPHDWIREPFLNMRDNTVWATDGHAALIVPTIMLNKIYKAHDTSVQIPEMISLDSCLHYTTKQLMDAIDKCGREEVMEEVEVVCPECDGDGTVLWEYSPTSNRERYEHEYECPVCDGEGHIYKEKPSGRFEPAVTKGVRIGEGVYSAWQLDRVVKAMNILGVDTLNIVSKPDRTHAVLFQFGNLNVHVLQMPAFIEDKKDIVEIDFNPDTELHCQRDSVSDRQPDSVSASRPNSDIR